MNISEKNVALLGFDLGTSALKAIALSADGEVLAEAKRLTRLIYGDNGTVEFCPDTRYADIVSMIRELKEALPGDMEIVALSMAAASGNAMLADAAGEPLTTAFSWMDMRTTPGTVETLEELHGEKVHEIVGWPAIPSFPLAHFAWLKRERPELYASAARYCMDTDYAMFRLTGRWVMDYSTATTFYLRDQQTGRWHEPFLKTLEILENNLSEPLPSGTPVGMLTPAAAADTGLRPDTLVVAGSFDHPSAARAAGACHPGDLMLSCGTSWVGFLPITDRALGVRLGMLIDPFLSPDGPWGAMVSVPKIGVNVDWYVDNLIRSAGDAGTYQTFDLAAERAEPGADGLLIDLSASPERVAETLRQASIENISRAVMEGAAFAAREKLEAPRAAGISADNIRLVGGPSRSDIWMRIIADVMGVKLILTDGHNAGAVGAAMLAGMGAGVYNNLDDARKRLAKSERVVQPDPGNHAIYNTMFETFRHKKNNTGVS